MEHLENLVLVSFLYEFLPFLPLKASTQEVYEDEATQESYVKDQIDEYSVSPPPTTDG